MKREEVLAIVGEDFDKDKLDKIMNLQGKDAEVHKSVKAELEKAKGTITELQDQVKTLTDTNAESGEWKTKFEELDKKIKDEQAQAETERLAKEKADNISKRFNAVDVDNEGKAHKWINEPTKAHYLNRFTEALESKDNEGKADAEIFNSLLKDDTTAFVTVQTQVLKGGELGGASDKGNPLTEKRLI